MECPYGPLERVTLWDKNYQFIQDVYIFLETMAYIDLVELLLEDHVLFGIIIYQLCGRDITM